MKKNKARDYFPDNYDHSRTRFKKATAKIVGPRETGSWKIDSPTDSDLTVDSIWLPPTKQSDTLVVLLSGIHGSETYAGSAVLDLFMEEILPKINRDRVGIFIVHAMNPYGFKNHRRGTENNVNLNRNFSVTGEIFKLKNPVSEAMNKTFLARTPVSSFETRLMQSLRHVNGQPVFGDTTLDQMSKGIFPGQYERPQDLEYGGQACEPQTLALIEMMKKLMPQYKDVIGLDLHTGLGDRGRLHVLTDGEGKTLNSELFSELFKPEQDKEIYAFTPPEAEGFYTVHGATESMFGDLAKPGQRVCAVTLEFGTLGHSLEQQVQDFNNFIMDHEGYFYGFTDEKLKARANALNFERSYPDDENWRQSILTAAEGLLLKVFGRLGALPES